MWVLILAKLSLVDADGREFKNSLASERAAPCRVLKAIGAVSLAEPDSRPRGESLAPRNYTRVWLVRLSSEGPEHVVMRWWERVLPWRPVSFEHIAQKTTDNSLSHNCPTRLGYKCPTHSGYECPTHLSHHHPIMFKFHFTCVCVGTHKYKTDEKDFRGMNNECMSTLTLFGVILLPPMMTLRST